VEDRKVVDVNVSIFENIVTSIINIDNWPITVECEENWLWLVNYVPIIAHCVRY